MDITAITADGVARAWVLIASVLTDSTLRDRPTVTHNVNSGKDEPSAWAVTENITAFFYDDTETERPAPSGGTVQPLLRKAIVNRLQIPAVTGLTTGATITEGAVTWRVHEVATPPGNGIFILSLHQ